MTGFRPGLEVHSPVGAYQGRIASFFYCPSDWQLKTVVVRTRGCDGAGSLFHSVMERRTSFIRCASGDLHSLIVALQKVTTSSAPNFPP
jgi:hypothetical protein